MADSNIEKYLKKLRGDDTDLPYAPQSNVETYLAKMAGQDVELPAEPESRVEALLADVVESGISGGGGDDMPSGPLDGKTRIYIHLEEGRLEPYLGFAVIGTATVDWGDGTKTDTVTGASSTTVINTQHVYAKSGDYVIAIAVDGELNLLGATSIGSKVLWKNSTSMNQNRVYQSAIRKVEIGIGSTKIGTNAFAYCVGLQSIDIPDGVTSIGAQAFYGCSALQSIDIPDGVTAIGGSMFYQCYALRSIVIPDGVTTIGAGPFSACSGLQSAVLPDGVTSIGGSMFYGCYVLQNIIIPKTVTSIGSRAFANCYGLGYIKFTSATPPTVTASDAWSNIPADCKIYVPAGSLEAYTTATNYPSSSTYTYIEY